MSSAARSLPTVAIEKAGKRFVINFQDLRAWELRGWNRIGFIRPPESMEETKAPPPPAPKPDTPEAALEATFENQKKNEFEWSDCSYSELKYHGELHNIPTEGMSARELVKELTDMGFPPPADK